MKYFLLLAGYHYYPQSCTDDWRGCFQTEQEARDQVKEVENKRTITRGKRKGEEEVVSVSYQIGDSKYDWFEIVDLRKWIG